MTIILYVEEFFLDHPHLKGPCTTAGQQLDRSTEAVFNIYKKMLCWRSSKKMLRTIDSQRVLAMMTEFDEKKERQSPLFKFVRSHMRMVLLRCKSSVMVYGSCNSCLWMLCASSSSLVTSRGMPGWLLSTLQRWLLFSSQIQTYIKNSWVDPILCHRGGSCSRVHQPHHDSHWGLVGISQSASVLLGTQMRSVSGQECTRSNWRRWKVQGSQWLTR